MLETAEVLSAKKVEVCSQWECSCKGDGGAGGFREAGEFAVICFGCVT